MMNELKLQLDSTQNELTISQEAYDKLSNFNNGLNCKINDIQGENRILKNKISIDEEKMQELQSDLNKSQIRESILTDQNQIL